jgi:hypothetical protein
LRKEAIVDGGVGTLQASGKLLIVDDTGLPLDREAAL